MTTHSAHLFEAAKKVLVGGVNSPVRAFNAVGGDPAFIRRAKGAYLYTEDDTVLIDYVLGWGAMLLGHADDDVTASVSHAVANGVCYGAPTENETKLAELIREFYPGMEKCRFVNSGTEAVMSVIRLARGATKRSFIVKFEGCYHGHSDSMLVSAGSGNLTFGHPDSAGVLDDTARYTYVLPFNDSDGVKALFSQYGDTIAAVIVEPVCGNMGVILPDPGFLHTLRQVCTKYGALLIFDEVMCGFRVGLTGAQGLYEIHPDLTCLGKIIAGGLPCGAFGGSAALMAHLSPEGPVYQAGTMSGNPVTVSSGIATLTKLRTTDAFEIACRQTVRLVDGYRQCFDQKGLSCVINTQGTMFSLFFTTAPVTSLQSAKTSDTALFKRYFHHMLSAGIYLPPSQFEANFVSSVHSGADIDRTVEAFEGFLKTI